jgi:hypothetical protein
VTGETVFGIPEHPLKKSDNTIKAICRPLKSEFETRFWMVWIYLIMFGIH